MFGFVDAVGLELGAGMLKETKKCVRWAVKREDGERGFQAHFPAPPQTLSSVFWNTAQALRGPPPVLLQDQICYLNPQFLKIWSLDKQRQHRLVIC